MAEEAVAQTAQDDNVTQANPRRRVMSIAPYSKEANIGDGHMLHFDATDNEVAKNVGRVLLIKGEGEAAEKSFGRYFLNQSEGEEGKPGKTYINVQFDDGAQFKNAVLFKQQAGAGNNFFSGNIVDKEENQINMSGNLVGLRNDAVAEWLGDYVFKKDLPSDEDDNGPR